jgi:hypothetical protein
MILAAFSVVIFWLVLLIILILQLLIARACRRTRVGSFARRSCYSPFRYWRSVIALYLFCYSTMANTAIGFLSCITVGNGELNGTEQSVIFVSPTISCNSSDYKLWYPFVIIVLIVMVLLPPFGFLIWLTRNRSRFMSPGFIGRFGSLYEPYISTAYWSVFIVLVLLTQHM